VASFH